MNAPLTAATRPELDAWLRQQTAVATAISLDAVINGEAPHPDIEAAIVTELARRYPHGGNQLCAALTDAVRLSWRLRHELQLIRENRDG